jgi:hypothetical protein
MPVWRMQVGWQKDTAFPRDRVVITPHFNDSGVGTDPDALCSDLAAGLQAITPTTGELRVTAYDAQGTPPVFPQGDHIVNPGATQATSQPRELAICLSYFSEQNRARHRGRLFIPLFFFGGSLPALRPPQGLTAMPALVSLFTGLGGPDVDWVVYSRRDDMARPVTNWWYDDEWDVQRSRGLRGTTRTTGTTSEG